MLTRPRSTRTVSTSGVRTTAAQGLLDFVTLTRAAHQADVVQVAYASLTVDGPRNFHGYDVGNIEQGIAAVISHYVAPTVGMIRLNDSDGIFSDHDTLGRAIRQAARVLRHVLPEQLTPTTILQED